MAEAIDRGRFVAAAEQAFRRVLVEEGLLGRLADRVALRLDDFSDPMHRWVWGQIVAGARSIDEVAQAAQREGIAADGLRRELVAMAVVLVPPPAHHTALIIEAARSRKVIDAGGAILHRLRLGDIDPDEALDALGKMATGPRRAK